MATILITGGSGLIGKQLAESFVRRGHQVTILSRNTGGWEEQAGMTFAHWDIRKKEIDLSAVSTADHIVHLAGAGVVAQKWTNAYKKEIVESRTESSRLLTEALQKNPNKVRSVISMSAIGWYGPDPDPVNPFTETQPADNGFLGETCRLWEESIEPVTSLGVRLVKFRTGIVLSHTGGALAEFRKPLRFGVAAILGKGNQVVSWIHITDLCNMFLYAIENEAMKGVYNAVAPNPVTNKEFTLSLARALKKQLFIPMHVPSFILKLMLGERSIEVMKSATVSSGKIQGTGFDFRYPTIREALEELVSIKDRP